MDLPKQGDNSPPAVGLRIRFLRKNMQMTGTEFALATRQSTGVVSNWERGRNRPTYEALQAVMAVTGASSDFILYGHIESLRGRLYQSVCDSLSQKSNILRQHDR